MNWHDLFTQIINKEFEQQKSRNPRLSMRQWAQKIGISSGAISEILSGRRKVTENKALEIIAAAKVSITDKKRLLARMGNPSEVTRIAPKKEDLDLIKDWVNHAICGFYELTAVKVNAKFIAERLLLTTKEVEEKTNLLLKRGLLKVDAKGNIFRTKENWDFSLTLNPIEVQEVRNDQINFSRIGINKAIPEKSLFLNFTFPGNKDHIDFICKEVKKITDSIDALIESEPSDELIRFSVQLFPFHFKNGIK